MMMSVNPNVSQLALYDLVNSPGVAVDLSHINSKCHVEGYKGPKELKKTLEGANMVIVSAGLPRKPGMTRDDLFMVNAGISFELAKACASICPKAPVLVITNPVNSTVPIYSEVYKKMGVHDPRKIMGVSILDSLRASTFISEALGDNESECVIPVVGGHAGRTIIPLLSQLPDNKIEKLDVTAVTKRIQFGGDEVVVAKAGMGSATLSMAYAGSVFADAVLQGLSGKRGIIMPVYVEQNVHGCQFFASQCEMGREGIEKILPIPTNITAREEAAINAAVPVIQAQISKGLKYVDQNF